MKQPLTMIALILIAGAGRGLAADTPALRSLKALAPDGGTRFVEIPALQGVPVGRNDTPILSSQAGCNVILMSFSDYAFTQQYQEAIIDQLQHSKHVKKVIYSSLPYDGVAQFSAIGVKDEDFSRALILKLRTMNLNEAGQVSELSYQYVQDGRIASDEIIIKQIMSSDASHDLNKKKRREIKNLLKGTLEGYCK